MIESQELESLNLLNFAKKISDSSSNFSNHLNIVASTGWATSQHFFYYSYSFLLCCV